jgi:methylase of polypeptide subunit release factors
MVILHEYRGITYEERTGVYPVERDSLFLLEVLENELEGATTLMDMGCGNGLATLLASSRQLETISIDREPLALMQLRSNLERNDLRSLLLLSDLFEGVPRSYRGWADLIIFNPPYLPTMGTESGRMDLALVGGSEGWETAARMMESSLDYLSDGGRLVVLVYEDWKMSDLDPDGHFQLCSRPVRGKDIDGESFEIMVLKRAKTNIQCDK